MQSWDFKSLVLSNEINLNTVAAHFGINKKYKWGDALVLSDNTLKGILRDVKDKWVYIYHFGSLVFINMEFHEIQDIIKYVKNIDATLKNNATPPSEYVDQYRLEVDPDYDYALYNDMMTASEMKPFYLDMLAIVQAKSTALKKIEVDTDKLLDSIENVINQLDTGKFNMSDRELAKTSAKVLRFKYNTISYLMLLDKPKSTWDNEDIEDFFLQAVTLFDLEDRYDKIRHKTEVLQDITDVFSSITHEKRGTKLELAVIVLILFELILGLIEFFLARH